MKTLILLLKYLFNFSAECKHEKILPNIESAYCPDCGKLIKNEWYIARCACCGVKIKAKSQNDKVVPLYHYCSNCGNTGYTIERLEEINFININNAVLIKKVLTETSKIPFTTQCWQEKTPEPLKLLTQYL